MMKDILPQIEVDQDTNCWLFTGTKQNGYGAINNRYTHRIVYAEVRGPVAKGTVLHHQCGQRACCNPWHLEALTRREHYLRHPHPMKKHVTHCKRGHEFTPENTHLYQGRRYCRACQKERDKKRKR
jgi:hypothetical protein